MKFYVFIYCISLVLHLTDLTAASALECSEDVDCPADEATCENNLCQCPIGRTLSFDASRCLEVGVGYAAPCEEDVQCAWLVGKYTCNTGQCKCADNWRYFKGKCIEARGLNEKCTQDEDCYASPESLAMKCSAGVCVCNDGFYPRGNFDCRPELDEGEACALDEDCKIENSTCTMYGCTRVTPPNTSSEETTTQETDTDAVEGTVTSEMSVLLTNRVKKELISRSYEIGNNCATDADCIDIPNSFCSPLSRKCVCKREYYLDKSGCVGEIGVNVGCANDGDCVMKPSRCVNQACECPSNYYFIEDRSKCTKTPVTPQFVCFNNVQCRIFGPSGTCVNGFCTCKLNTQLDEHNICRAIEGGSGYECVQDSDCEIENFVCLEHKCICPDTHRLEGDRCLPNIGGACNIDSDCHMENSNCDNSVCRCNKGYIPNGPVTCLEAVEGIGSLCEEDVQCTTAIENSQCADGECVCSGGFVLHDEECRRERFMGDYCTVAAQCHVLLGNNVQCRKSICQCSSEMEVTPDGLDCQQRSSAVPNRLYTSLLYFITLALFYLVH